jgi:arylsulfatase A-like enzyme
VSLLDVAPTLLDLLGVSSPPGMHGTSLRPLLEGDAAGSPVFAVAGVEPDMYSVASVEGRHKLLVEHGRGGPRRRLFDLGTDPDERHDLSSNAADVVDAMLARQAAWATRVDLRPPRTPASPTPVPPDVREQLRALGYLD